MQLKGRSRRSEVNATIAYDMTPRQRGLAKRTGCHALAAWAILGESMTAQQALGGTLILCGLMLMRMSRKGR